MSSAIAVVGPTL